MMSLLLLTYFTSFILSSRSASLIPCAELPFPPSDADVASFISNKFDYIVIGGGTAGMAVAARLAEDAKLTVGVIEAGAFHKDDPIVDVPGLSGKGNGNSSYDWDFVSAPQANAAGRNLSLPRGKMLGGSSGNNGLAWGRASSVEYDAWKKFAPASDWSWSELLPFMKQTETFALSPPNPFPGITQKESQTALDDLPRVDGFSGPISASYNSFYFEVVPMVVEAVNSLGIPTNPEPTNGHATGIFNSLLSIDREHGVRSYSAIGYYCNQPPKPNLHILAGAQATKIYFSNTNPELTATGVQFAMASQSYVVNATKEVILSAGTLQTPQLLELSGIGNSTILKAHGIPTLVDLPGVGENFQEHLYAGVQWRLKPGYETFDILRNNATFAAQQEALYNENRTGLLADTDGTLAFVPLDSVASSDSISVLLETFDREAKQAGISSLQAVQFPIQRAWVDDHDVALYEIIEWSSGSFEPAVNQSYITILGGILHPTSRGSVHIKSSDPLAAPTIDPNFLSTEFDTLALLDILEFVQRIGREPPISDAIAEQTNPDVGMQSEDELIEYIRSTCAGGDHLIGTAAMAARHLGGVVDPSLRVYGTKNVRIADASVFPLHVAAHTQATVYAIAEKLAAMIHAGK